MFSGLPSKTRRDRVAGLDLSPGWLDRTQELLGRGDVRLRLGMCLLAAVCMLLVTNAWYPPPIYHEGQTRSHGFAASIDFRMPDPKATEEARAKAKRQARQVYRINAAASEQLRALLQARLAELTEAKQFDAKTARLWQEFFPAESGGSKAAAADAEKRVEEQRRQFERFRAALSGEWRLRFDDGVKKALAEFESHGLLEKLTDTREEQQNLAEIIVYPAKDWTAAKPVSVNEVRIADIKPKLLANLRRELQPLEAEILEQERRQARQVYALNPEPLVKLQAGLMDSVTKLAEAKEFNEATANLWREFVPKPAEKAPPPNARDQRPLFEKFREAVATPQLRADLAAALTKALAEPEKTGLLVQLKGPDEAAEGNQTEIVVYPAGNESARQTVKVAAVLLANVKPKVRESLEHDLKSLELAARVFIYLDRELSGATTLEYQPAKKADNAVPAGLALADRTYDWLERHLSPTLDYDPARSHEVREAAAADVKAEDYDKQYKVGMPLVEAGHIIGPTEIELLNRERQASLAQLTTGQMFGRLLAVLGMYFALYTLCGCFIHYRYPRVLNDTRRLGGLLVLAVLAVAACFWLDAQRAEMVPLLLFGMIVAIAYHQELALLLLAAVGLVVVLSIGEGLPSYIVLTAASATAVLLLRRVRSRTKLIYVGVAAGTVASLTRIGVAVVDGQVLGETVLQAAGLAWVWGVAAGFLITGLLPFIESVFGVLTDISLLELGDVAHPLLQELVRRAPGTYNHSINVASMAEAAAERIGAQGLLVRVGAYFHDIGKILKPEYFVENQQSGDNRHESLVPAMSTLIIIAHVKDGADLARQHHLPRPIIDFIQQHHGTTLVEYFYRRASEKSSDDPDSPEVDENTFRYPGPKPQTREAGILMLSDAVESASRVLVEPTPARIENLIQEITMKRLLDGQFDECSLTLQEVHVIEESLVKSLTAVYHGRVKYPEQKTA